MILRVYPVACTVSNSTIGVEKNFDATIAPRRDKNIHNCCDRNMANTMLFNLSF